MAIDKQQSSIKEARDQLFLDTADGSRLDIVTSNLGLDRPISGFSDDEWRAVAKEVALQSKQIRNIFYRIMEICLGPQKTRRGVLEVAPVAGESIVQLEDSSNLLQLGSLVFDPGLATEETVTFCFRDVVTNKVFLETELQFAHNVLDDAASHLLRDHPIGSTSLSVIDSALFPVTGFPYSIVVDRGKESEETLVVTANTLATNILTLQDPTTIFHKGPKATFVRKPLEDVAAVGRTFIVLDADDTRVFPATGFVRINKAVPAQGSITVVAGSALVDGDNFTIDDGVTSITFEYDDDSSATGTPISFTGSETATVIRNNTISAINSSGLLVVASPVGTDEILVVHLIGGTSGNNAITESVADGGFTVSGLSGGVGGPEETIEFTANDVENDSLTLKTPLQNVHVAGESVELVYPGAAVETCSVLQFGVDWSLHETEPRKITVFTPEESLVLTLRDASYLHGAVPAPAATVLTQELAIGDDVLVVSNASGFAVSGIASVAGTEVLYVDKIGTTQLVLAENASFAAANGSSVSAVLTPYSGTDLEEGNIRTAGGDVQEGQFSGPYVYDVTQQAPTLISGFLDETLPPATRVAADQVASTTSVEVLDASDYPAPPFTPFTLRVGTASPNEENTICTDRTLRTSVSTTVDSLAVIGSITIDGVNTAGFPQDNGVNPAGYRIIVDEGGPNEEVLLVSSITIGTPGTFTLVNTTTIAHSPGETINLLADVLTVDPLLRPHSAVNPSVSFLGELVEKLTDELTLGSGEGLLFPDNGTVHINFGKERINARQKIVSATPTSITFQDSSVFPQSDFPYKITVAEGLPTEEVAFVIANSTGSDTLTLSTAMANTPSAGSYVEFTAGDPVVLDYVDRDGDVLELATLTSFPSGYTEGERVTLSGGFSDPELQGNDYAFLLPPTIADCLEFLFDLVRAAGIEVVFITDR